MHTNPKYFRFGILRGFLILVGFYNLYADAFAFKACAASRFVPLH